MSKLFIVVDNNVATVLNQNDQGILVVNGTPTPAPIGYMSDLAQMFAMQTGKPVPAPAPANPTYSTTTPEVRQAVTLVSGQHYDFKADASRKIVELTRTTPIAVQLHVEVEQDSPNMRLQLAGADSSDPLVGGVAVAIGTHDAATFKAAGEGNIESFDYNAGPVTKGQWVTLSLRLDSGDPKVLFVIWA